MKDYFEGNDTKYELIEKRRKGFDEVLERKKISINDQSIIFNYIQALNKYWIWKFFALKKDDEPRHFQGNVLMESRSLYTKEQLTKVYKHKEYECQTVVLPWFIVWDMYDRLARKYYKGPAHGEEIETYDDYNPFPFIKRRTVGEWISPSNNPEYQWKKGWEYNVHPLEFKNLREFMKTRIKARKKYSKLLVEAQVEEKIREEERQRQLREEEEKAKVLQKQARNEALRDKRYKSIETVARDPAVYILCERRKIFTTKVKNKCNTLYVGESLVFSSRMSAYQDFNKPNNELVNKLANKLKKSKDYVVRRIKDNVRIRVLRFKSMEDNAHRREIEGYLIKRLNPLINSSKKRGFFKRSFIEKHEPGRN